MQRRTFSTTIKWGEWLFGLLTLYFAKKQLRNQNSFLFHLRNLGSLLREMESMQAANTRAHSTINKINSTLALVDDGTDKTTCQYCRKDIETRLLPIHERDCKEKKNSLSPRRHAAKKSTSKFVAKATKTPSSRLE